MSILALLIVLGVLVFVHELGLFLAAKAVGIQVVRFSIGFGAPILSWRWGETEYRLAWVPLGGYVKMAGLEDEGMAGDLEGKLDVPVDPERAFDRKPVWARVIVLSAGVIMNAVLAFAIFAGLGVAYGVPQRSTTQVDTVLTNDLPPGAEALGTLRFGDRITRVNGDSVSGWNDILRAVYDSTVTEVTVQVAGRSEPVVARIGDGSPEARDAVARAIVAYSPPKLGVVETGRPGHRAGLRVNDVILRANGDTIRSWGELVTLVKASPDVELKFDVLRRGKVVPVAVVPGRRGPADTAGGARVGDGVMYVTPAPARSYVPQPFGAAIAGAADQTVGAALAIVRFLGRLFSGNEPLRQLGGPVLIAQISGQMLQMGAFDFLWFLAFFSVQLAVLNLLPIPVLDGGHLVFLLAESVRGKPIPVGVRVRLLNIGFWLLIAIMLLAVGNDVLFRLLPL